MKTCRKCKSEKPVVEFGKHTRKLDGLRDNCKNCENKPPRIQDCLRCGAAFSHTRMGFVPLMCDGCRQTHYRCHVCLEVKELGEFYRQASSKTGHQAICRVCTLAKINSDAGVRASKKRAVRTRYGISLEEYEELTSGGVCSCCGRRRRLVLDHCHKTGRVRAAICYGCNTGLGKFGDDVGRLQEAIQYLERYGSCQEPELSG